MSITFSTCWYIFKAKFDPSIYQQWFANMLSNVNNYNLVIYCDENSYKQISMYSDNPRIKIVIKPYEEFYTYRYRDSWIKNHETNDLLKTRVDWKLNMLWSEKVHFVYETMSKKYFDTDFYGWCDIGYFRGRSVDLGMETLRNWPDSNKINGLNKNKIYYACVNNNQDYMRMIYYYVKSKGEYGLPLQQIPANQVSVAGGFFISHKDKLEWWRDTFDRKLALYFQHDYLVKDDQIIIVDCVFSDMDEFQLCYENDSRYDNWFMFQRLLH